MNVKEETHELLNFRFSLRQSGLSTSDEIESIAQECRLFRPPTIIFGANQFLITQQTTGIQLLFNANQALRLINYQHRQQCHALNHECVDSISYLPQKLQIRHAQKWKTLQVPKDVEITEIVESSDSFFLTPFKGKFIGKVKIEQVSEQVIPLQKLGPQNQMKFYHQGVFYEDELDDNGLIQYDYKFRAMANSWFALIRLYARVDEVAVQILDTRIYWQQGWNKIARQFLVKKETWSELKAKGFETIHGFTMNHNQSHMVYPYLKEAFVQNQYIHFK